MIAAAMEYTNYPNDNASLVIELSRGTANVSELLGHHNRSLYNSSTLDHQKYPYLPAAIGKAIPMIGVMVLAAFGNVLVITSVFRYEKLRIVANSFIVSLAFADLLVAVLVMPFNASHKIVGKWIFGPIMCDIFNANDVLFSTASLLHLCCISMDRYIAISQPFQYEFKMTKCRVIIMLCFVWGAASLISYIPIQLGWYTTADHKEQMKPDQCDFVVNQIYMAVSSSISFWIPTFIMVFIYMKIYRTAKRQEKEILKLTRAGRASLDYEEIPCDKGDSRSNSKKSIFSSMNGPNIVQHKRKIKKEHKAAKTLGMIMGAFLACWLPFFTWYVSTTICVSCKTPDWLITTLFWIGYFNSALNPIIYALFNRDFRTAFKKLLGIDRAECRCWRTRPESENLAHFLMQRKNKSPELNNTPCNSPSPIRFPRKYTYETVDPET